MKKTILVILAILVAGALIYYYYGSESYDQTSNQPQQEAEGPSVSMENTTFSPESLTILTGQEVTWVNNDSVNHTVTREGSFDSGNISPGASFSHTFKEPGVYDYECTIHPSMRGEIIVE